MDNHMEGRRRWSWTLTSGSDSEDSLDPTSYERLSRDDSSSSWEDPDSDATTVLSEEYGESSDETWTPTNSVHSSLVEETVRVLLVRIYWRMLYR